MLRSAVRLGGLCTTPCMGRRIGGSAMFTVPVTSLMAFSLSAGRGVVTEHVPDDRFVGRPEFAHGSVHRGRSAAPGLVLRTAPRPGR